MWGVVVNFKLKLVKPKTIQLKQKNLVVVEPEKEWATVKSTEEEQVVLPTGKKVISRVIVEPIQLEETNTIPTKSQQIITASENYDAMKKVTVEPIPDLYIDTSDATATVDDIVKGKSAYVNGEKLDGTLNVITEVKDIIFIDYKGNILATYGLDELPLSELPEAPQFAGLTFTGYNSSLEEINAIEKGRYHIIGACYEPTDNNTHIFYDLGEFVFERTYSASILISSTSGGQIDWGDGTVDSFGTGNSTLAHNYSNLPSQKYEAVISADKLTFRAYAFIGGSISQRDNLIAEIWFASHVSISGNTCRQLVDLKYVVFPLASLFLNLFMGCFNLIAIVLQKDVFTSSNISRAFESCNNLEIYSFPVNIPIPPISNLYFFNYCYKLKYSQYLKNLTEFSAYFYNYNYSLEEIIFPDDITKVDSYFCGHGLMRVELNEGLQTIEISAFQNSNITQVTIPSTVKAIGSYAFQNTYSLTNVWIKPIAPPTLGNTSSFYRHENLKIYVPLESLEAYKKATNWTVFADYMEGY